MPTYSSLLDRAVGRVTRRRPPAQGRINHSTCSIREPWGVQSSRMGQIAYTAWGRGLRRVLGLLAAWGRWGPRWGVLSMTQRTTCGEASSLHSRVVGIGIRVVVHRSRRGGKTTRVRDAPGRRLRPPGVELIRHSRALADDRGGALVHVACASESRQWRRHLLSRHHFS